MLRAFYLCFPSMGAQRVWFPTCLLWSFGSYAPAFSRLSGLISGKQVFSSPWPLEEIPEAFFVVAQNVLKCNLLFTNFHKNGLHR